MRLTTFIALPINSSQYTTIPNSAPFLSWHFELKDDWDSCGKITTTVCQIKTYTSHIKRTARIYSWPNNRYNPTPRHQSSAYIPLLPGGNVSTINKSALTELDDNNPKGREIEHETIGRLHCQSKKYKYPATTDHTARVTCDKSRKKPHREA